MDKMTKTFQQGDVLFRRLCSLPEGEQKQVSTGKCVVAHGESGHSHVIEAPETDAELIEIGGRMLLNLKSDQIVKHEEHNAQMLEAGVWEIGRVREFDHFAEQERTVRD